MQEYDLLVIGSGPAGQKAAIAAARMGKRAAVIERNMSLGGACLHHGTIPSKTLREVAAYFTGLRLRETYGVAYRVKERISIEDLTYRTRRVIENEINIVRDQLIRNYVDVIGGTATFVDAHTLEVTGDGAVRTLSAEKIVIAVGSKPTRPDGIDFDDRYIVDSDGLLKLPEIPRSMIFVGGGVIGSEYATIFRTLGAHVTVIDRRERPLDFVDDEIEDALYYQMRDEGVTLRFGEDVLAVSRPADDKVHVETKSGKQFTSDALMFAAGRVGCSDSLNLEAIGLERDKRGRICVDKHYRDDARECLRRGRRHRVPQPRLHLDGARPHRRHTCFRGRLEPDERSPALRDLHHPGNRNDRADRRGADERQRSLRDRDSALP